MSSQRDIELSSGTTLSIKEGHLLENTAGAVVWDAALVLIHYLDKHPTLVQGKRSIEVGSGTGAVSIAAAALGVQSIVATDLLDSALLKLIYKNVAAYPSISVEPLDWTEDDTTKLNPPFELVLASDVLYQQEVLPAFVSTLKALCDANTLVFLSNEHRAALPFPRQLFERAGFEVHIVPTEELHEDWRSPDIHVYKITLKTTDPETKAV